ncbi:asparaginase [Croceicoccus naphthovorans]|uniref:Asparaginase n=1 Tax=Croceicoccus naphthovorans TaxID=1348774 RepID=A0A0G3XJX0_9SPHN|nr:asparaginase [Croceicoccus naphthovorans]AKM10889.1 hypothetical protein AB433_14420 [Croceicoccus naphthovorans]
MPRRVHVLATGGTIAGTKSATSPVGYSPGELSVETLLAAVPTARDIADISVEQLFSIGSQNITERHWVDLLDRIAAYNRDNPDVGIVVLHGTDTIEETAWFLDLQLDQDSPVVLVGAMRPANAVSADGPANLIAAIIAAADPAARGRGVLVCSDNEILSARNAMKTATLGVQGFSAGKRGVEAFMTGNRAEWLGPAPDRSQPCFSPQGGALPDVEILFVHAAMSIHALDDAIARGTQGIVVAGVGSGNMPMPLIERLAQAARDGIVVVRSSRIAGGYVARNVEIDDDANGFVVAGDLGPAKSRILLQLAMRQTHSAEQIQDLFAKC